VTIAPSKVDLLPDGSLLLAQSRYSRRPFEPDNAQVFSGSGQALRSFRIGDGVAHLAVDEPGTIWVGYYDEGIYSGDPLSAGGLARFDEYGRQLWTYRPPSGLDHIADCYALNVSARTTWAYYYTGFPLIRITDTKVSPSRRVWSAERAACSSTTTWLCSSVVTGTHTRSPRAGCATERLLNTVRPPSPR
jgi:hypothetical protein